MRADLPPVNTTPRPNGAIQVPFAYEYVTLSKQEHIELKYEAQVPATKSLFEASLVATLKLVGLLWYLIC